MRPPPPYVKTLVISGLRLLMEGYKLVRDRFKDKRTPEQVEEIVTRAERTPKVNTKQIEESITQTLDPADAAIVKNDLEFLSLLSSPPRRPWTRSIIGAS